MVRTGIRLAAAAALFAWVAIAQTGNASISGQVKDQTGAVMPGTTIAIRNMATNVVITTETNSNGYYSVPNLIPGTYSLTASFQGFKNMERSNIVLQVGDRLGLDLAMEVGSQGERVTVTGEVALLRTEDAQTGLVIDNRRIQELPQYDRNPLAFAMLTPNVSAVPGTTNDLRVNAGRSGQTEFFLDGVPLTTGYDHSVPASYPSREAIGEFKVVTNGMSAEYGRLSGGAVVLVTKSGTNEFHGSAYEFFRNDKMNANDWNSNRFGRAKGVFHDNVFGATFGGPVRIPKVYNGRDKTFFFFNYEGTRRVTGSNASLAGVPSLLERQGDFSQSLIESGTPVQIFDPLTGRQEGTRVRRDPFPGNVIPKSRFDPMAQIYLNYYPEPTRPAMTNSSHDQNYIGTSSNPYSNDRWTGRLDQNWNSSHMTHMTITRYDDKLSTTRWISDLQPVTVSYSTAHTVSADHTYTLTPTSILSFRAGVMRRASISGTQVDADASAWPYQREVLNLLGTTQNRVPTLGTNDTIATLGGGSTNNVYDTTYSGVISLQKIWGRHTLKMGVEHRRYYSNLFTGGSVDITTDRRMTTQYYDTIAGTGSGFASWLLGRANWGQGTQLAGPASLQTYWGSYIQDDIKVTSKLTINAGIRWDFEPPRTERFDRQIVWDADYKWDWTPNPGWSWDAVQKQAGITFAPPSWLTNGIYGRAAMLGTKEYPMRSLQKEYPYHFGPRVGVAYQFLPRTVFRAGYGLNWMTMTGDTYLNNAALNVGYGDQARLMQDGTADGGLTYPLSFSIPMPNGTGYVPFTRDVAALNRSVMGNWFVTPSYQMYPGYEHAVTATLQREFGSAGNSWVVEVAYSGNFGRDLPFDQFPQSVPDAYHVLGVPLGNALNTNVDNPFYGQIPDGTTMGGKVIPLGRVLQTYPLLREIDIYNQPRAWSNYHSGYVQVEHRFSKGFSILGNYTFGKALQSGGGQGAVRAGMHFAGAGGGGDSQGYPQAELPLSDVYGLAPFDITHRGMFNYLWELPFGKGRRFLNGTDTIANKVIGGALGGWNISGTTTFRGGSPFALVCGGSYCRNWISIGQGRHTRPRFTDQRVPYINNLSGHAALEGSANQQYYFNPAAFRYVNDMEIGDVGSTLQGVRGPGFSQWDFAVSKNFGLGSESRYLQFRGEFENIFNHMNADMPDSTLSNRTFGLITKQNGNPRRILIAAKFYF
ncbi:MAG TPA: carboxypeptidase regulatory-like domain-containing protein [Bryobacteraceae bacterium]|jgi:hypothetical protein|nr:carboxypeptidase regulatory-like domain-containing protein [Bryobacteraceae bacterium]